MGSLHFNRGSSLIHQNSPSRSFSPSFCPHLWNRPALAHPLWIGRAFEHAVWSPRTVFEMTCCSKIEIKQTRAHAKKHRSRWRTNWEFFPYRHSWQTLSWHYLKSIRTIECNECLAATLNTWGIILHTGEQKGTLTVNQKVKPIIASLITAIIPFLLLTYHKKYFPNRKAPPWHAIKHYKTVIYVSMRRWVTNFLLINCWWLNRSPFRAISYNVYNDLHTTALIAIIV